MAGSKFDVFANEHDPMKKRQFCLALRYLCHKNGADLCFASVKERLPLNIFKAMLYKHTFELTERVKTEKDPNQCLNVYGGSDSFLNIGEPEVSALLILRCKLPN